MLNGVNPIVPLPIPVMPLPPSGIPARIREAVERIERHLLVLRALEYMRCRRAGGSLEECLGIYRVTPPRPDESFMQELLRSIHPEDRQQLLTAVKQELKFQGEIVEKLE
jgi:hypothetical protein